MHVLESVHFCPIVASIILALLGLTLQLFVSAPWPSQGEDGRKWGEGARQGKMISRGIDLRGGGWEKTGRICGEEDAAGRGLKMEEEGVGDYAKPFFLHITETVWSCLKSSGIHKSLDIYEYIRHSLKSDYIKPKLNISEPSKTCFVENVLHSLKASEFLKLSESIRDIQSITGHI